MTTSEWFAVGWVSGYVFRWVMQAAENRWRPRSIPRRPWLGMAGSDRLRPKPKHEWVSEVRDTDGTER